MECLAGRLGSQAGNAAWIYAETLHSLVIESGQVSVQPHQDERLPLVSLGSPPAPSSSLFPPLVPYPASSLPIWGHPVIVSLLASKFR